METRFEKFRYSIINESDAPLMEGIDIDFINKIVSFSNKHENNINTSDIINPTYYKIGKYDVISIFKRLKSNIHNLDGNPLIKALKNIDGWKLKNCESDINNLLKQFIKISSKIENKYDTIITVPSNNKLNIEFLHRLNKIIKCDNEITDMFIKLKTEEIIEFGLDRDLINKSNNPEYILSLIFEFLSSMDKENDGYFSYKMIKDNKYRKYFKNTMKYNNIIDYNDLINNKKILILDDTISIGNTISEVCKNILDVFTPENITIITLFSPLN